MTVAAQEMPVADGQASQLMEAQAGAGQRHRGALFALLRRVVAPRGPAVLVMEPDGRLVSARPARCLGQADPSLRLGGDGG